MSQDNWNEGHHPTNEHARLGSSADWRDRGDTPHRSVRLADGKREVPLGVNERQRPASSSLYPDARRGFRQMTPRGPRIDGARPAGSAARQGGSPSRAAGQRAEGPRSARGSYRGTAPVNTARRTGANQAPRSTSLRGTARNERSGGHRNATLGGNYSRSYGYLGGGRGRSGFGQARGSYPYLRSSRIFTRTSRLERLLRPGVIVAIIALALVGGSGFAIYSSAQQRAAEEAAQAKATAERKRLAAQKVDPLKLGIGAYPVSTPRSEWTQGSMPHLYQTDPAWANLPYAGGTVRANACGPTSLSMVYVYLTGQTDLDPGDMAAFADQNDFAPTGATEWSFMTAGASLLGIHSTSLPVNRSSITHALANGFPVICSVDPGDFTTVGHYIVLKSIDDRGMVEVFDPNSPYNSARRWDIQRIVNQTGNCWSFWA